MSASDYVMLRGGLTVPVAALQVLWSLEHRGVSLRLDDEDVIIANPRAKLTDEDRVAIRRWKLHVVALLQYGEEQRETIQ